MKDVERYQRELDAILRDTEERAKRASYLYGIETIDQLFAHAMQVGISQTEAWRIIDKTPNDPKAGLLALIQELQNQSAL